MTADVIVVGAGISGLTAAYRATQRGQQVLVLEEREAAGGCIHSHRFPSGFWLELGAHTGYATYQGLLEVIEACGALPELTPRRKAPFRLFTGGIARSVVSQISLLSLLINAPRIAFTSKEGKTVAGYYRALVGAGNYRRVFSPLFAAVPSQPADDFPAELLFKSRPRRKGIAPSYTFRNGLSSAVAAIARAPGITLRTRARVEALRLAGGRFTVTLSGGEALEASHVILAVPPADAARLAAPIAPRAAQAVGQLRSVPVRTIGVAVRRDALSLEPVAGIVPLDEAGFYSCVSRDTVPDDTWRGFAFHLRPGVTRDQALDAAAAVLQVSRATLTEVAEREVSLPSPAVGHSQRVQAIDEGLAGQPLGIAGNYFLGLSLEDCVQRATSEVARLLPR